jgi:small subunit ribosomal protein S16
MVRIRLRRVGAKKKPSYRIVVVDSRAPRDGAYIENIGHYDPMTDPPTIRINQDRARYWLRQGAQPSERLVKLMQRSGLLSEGTA